MPRSIIDHRRFHKLILLKFIALVLKIFQKYDNSLIQFGIDKFFIILFRQEIL